MGGKNGNDWFHCFSHKVADALGSPKAFALALFIVVAWWILGPMYGYSDTWQLVINTGTTIMTFLAVFLIQNTQNRDAKAVHLKLDELIRASSARDRLVDLEEFSEDELDKLQEQFRRVRARAEQRSLNRSLVRKNEKLLTNK